MNQTDTKTKTADPIDVAVEELEAWKRRLTITVDAKDVVQARAKERKKLAKKLRIKGFRAGKVPTHIVEQKYGDLVDQRTVQSLVENAYREAVRRQSLDPIGAPEFGQVNYAAAKSGIHGFTKALALEGAGKGITVNAVAPGYVDTDMVRAVPDNVLEKIIATIPVGRLGKAEDIARSVLFLVADDADFITGSTITVNGGHHMY